MDKTSRSTAFGSVFERFEATAKRHPERPFLNVVGETADRYGIMAGERTYSVTLDAVGKRSEVYRSAGLGRGHRIGLLLENRPSFFVEWLALNAIGASVVPINPDLRRSELEHLISHSELCLVVAIPGRHEDLDAAISSLGSATRVVSADSDVPEATSRARDVGGGPDDEAALLYTSGTTGRPKGCVLNNSYFLNCADWYRRLGGLTRLSDRGERMLTPLPLFHMNAMACSTMAMIEFGGCLTVLDRFHPLGWWRSVRESRATIIHYLGVMPPILMAAAPAPGDRDHEVRFAFGAGVDGRLHGAFEKRFGFPLIEAWAMTETGLGGVIAANEEPRHVGTNNFGRPAADVDVRVVDQAGADVVSGTPGELLVRRAGEDPRRGFFDRYLKDPAATDEAWNGGWFHTGDIVRRIDDGSFVFVDRRKNIVRRSGENIAAVEVESVLAKHEDIAAAAVLPFPDEVRGEEVFALVVRRPPAQEVGGAEETRELAERIVAWCLAELAYYKAPGYIAFVGALPLTSTNKIQRGALPALATQIAEDGQVIDLRHMKRRTAPA